MVTATPPSFPENCRVFLDGVDCTQWLFGSETITPTELQHRWHNIDITLYVKEPGLHKLTITAETGVGRVDARIALS